MVLKYNGSILKVNHGASTLGYSGPVPTESVWDGTYDYSWYNTTDTVGKYALKSDFTFKGA